MTRTPRDLRQWFTYSVALVFLMALVLWASGTLEPLPVSYFN